MASSPADSTRYSPRLASRCSRPRRWRRRRTLTPSAGSALSEPNVWTGSWSGTAATSKVSLPNETCSMRSKLPSDRYVPTRTAEPVVLHRRRYAVGVDDAQRHAEPGVGVDLGAVADRVHGRGRV